MSRSLEETITLTLSATAPFTPPGVLTLYIGAQISTSTPTYGENPTATPGSYKI